MVSRCTISCQLRAGSGRGIAGKRTDSPGYSERNGQFGSREANNRVAKADWFVLVRDEVRGPFTSDQMREAARKGLVKPSTSVRRGSEGDWFRAEQVQGLIPHAPPQLDPPAAAESQPIQPPPAPVPPPPDPLRADLPVADPQVPGVVTAEPPASTSRVRRRRRRRSNPWQVLIAAAVGIGLLLGMLIWLTREPPADPPPQDTEAAARK